MRLEDYKTILYRQDDGSRVAEIPAIPGCYALMPTREAALGELTRVFQMIAGEYSEKGQEAATAGGQATIIGAHTFYAIYAPPGQTCVKMQVCPTRFPD